MQKLELTIAFWAALILSDISIVQNEPILTWVYFALALVSLIVRHFVKEN